jgi:DNA-binding GntR family transcriptional regulator
MSPEAAAAHQVYHQLKSDIMGGRYAPTSTLNVHRIATEIGVSVIPIRDAMERLVGERMVVVRSGGGFQMPPMTTEIARDMYMWHAYLARGAVRPRAAPDQFEDLQRRVSGDSADDGASLAAATAEYFELLGEITGSLEHLLAIRAAGERLHALRLQEPSIKDRKAELNRLAMLAMSGPASALRHAITAYHRRRLHHLRTVVDALYHPTIRI